LDRSLVDLQLEYLQILFLFKLHLQKMLGALVLLQQYSLFPQFWNILTGEKTLTTGHF